MFQRIFLLSNGNRVFFSKNPPFGFWSINYAKGGMPQRLQGMFTTFHGAYSQLESYLGHRGITIGEEEEWLDAAEM